MIHFLPVVQRELLVASRSTVIRWQRFGAVTLGVFVFLLVVVSSRQTPQAVGGQLFHLLAALLWVLAWLSGPLFTTDALTREKREGTLGLLLLTELRGYDIVLGKAAASASHQVMLLVGVLPVLALPVAMGGITGRETFQVMASLLLTQAFSLAVGLLCSAGCRTFYQALGWTVGVLAAVTLLPVILDLLLKTAGRPAPQFLLALGPLGLTACGFDSSGKANPTAPIEWPRGASWLLLASIAAVLGAGGLLRRSLRLVESVRMPPTRLKAPHPLTGWRHVHDRELLGANPFHWLQRVAHAGKPPLARIGWGLITIALLLALVSPICRSSPAGWFEGLVAAGLLTAYLATQVVKTGLVMAGVGSLGEDVRSGAMELLLTTPLPARDLVDACRTTLAESCRPLQWGLSAVYAAWGLVGAWVIPTNVWQGLVSGMLIALGAATVLHVDLNWGALIALRAGVRESDPLKAARKAILRWMAPGWCVATTLVLPAVFGGRTGTGLLLWFCLLSVAVGIYMARSAARRASLDLEFGLRDIAAGLHFDTDQRELAEDFRRAAMTWEDRWFNRH